MKDTIAAISTATGVGAISIIRVSGVDAVKIVNGLTKYKKLEKAHSHTIHYEHIMDHDKVIDEVLISVMLAPKTFTCEDVVEINTHGGIATTHKVLELLLMHGCRLAEPGEFTKRAFLNGRIDLMQAEGIMDLIQSKTEKAREIAINQVDGKVSSMIKNLRQDIVEILANIEVNIDYPEYEDIVVLSNQDILPKLDLIEQNIKNILNKSENGKLIKEGIKTSIIGRPNVGKSSLLNCLLEEEKAIVTDVAGTTRDIVEGMLNLDGILLRIIDTAGIRKTDDVVESIGVQKSLDLIQQSDLVLLVLSNTQEILSEESELIEKIKEKPHLILINKADLKQEIDISNLNGENVIFISALLGSGIDELKKKIKELYQFEKIETEDATYLTNARSLSLLRSSLDSLHDAKQAILSQVPIDMVEIDIKLVWEKLGEIIGETYQEELINQLFSQFCLGK